MSDLFRRLRDSDEGLAGSGLEQSRHQPNRDQVLSSDGHSREHGHSTENVGLICHVKISYQRQVSGFFLSFFLFSFFVVFSRVHATLQPALSVRRSVGPTLLFLLLLVILSHFRSF